MSWDRDSFLAGWLDALACAGEVDCTLQMIDHARRELMRRGWIRYRTGDEVPADEVVAEHDRACMFTPMGVAALKGALKATGIASEYGLTFDDEEE